ncbi:MAG: cytochrome c oxidase subunit II [Fimbriimonas sp.]
MELNFPLAPPQASNFAVEHDAIFYALVILTVVFSLIVGLAVVFFTIRFREGSSASRKNPSFGDLRLEIGWSIIPLILGIIMFFFSAQLFIKMRTMPKDATEIFVIGKQWMWHAQHPNGVRENNTLHVPVGRPVKLTMISQDVIHAFYIPAFRVQYHVVPGRYTQMWFTATQKGEYHLFCGMYCGTQHSEMGGRVVAMDPAEYADWLANGGQKVPPMTMEQAGEKLYSKLGCNNCHGAQDNVRAPSLYALLGKKRDFSNGASLKADEGYIRESILRPYNRLTKGYEQSMPAYEGQISEEDVMSLIAFLRTMGSGSANLQTEWKGATPGDGTMIDGKNALATGALNYRSERADATPTDRNRLATGAIADQESRR